MTRAGMGSKDVEARLSVLVDHHEIRECLLRYARGVDRVDEALIRSAFHPDAADAHGLVNGSVDDFLDWWLPQQAAREVSQHYLTNITVDLDGDRAHAESYFIFVLKKRASAEMTLAGGRYADRLERRADAWRIAERLVVREWGTETDGSLTSRFLAELSLGRKDLSDPTYQRPLRGPAAP